MGLQANPIWIGEGSFANPVESDRNMLEQVFTGRTGIIRPGHFAVAPTGTARQVSVTSGGMVLVGTESSTQGAYMIWSDGTDNYTFAAAVGNPRIDTLVARVVDKQYGSDPGVDRAEIEIVQGVAGSSPTARADSYFNTGGLGYKPGAWYRLADVRINVVDGVLPSGQITQTSQYARQGGFVVCTSTTRPTDAAVGDRIYETDTKFMRYFDGTNWPYMPGTVIKRGTNANNKTWTSGAVVPYLRLDTMGLVANQQYVLHFTFRGSVGTSGDTGQVNFYINTAGSAATISDTQLTFVDMNASGAFVPSQGETFVKPFSSGTNVTASILAGVGKAGGTGNFSVNGNLLLTEMWVEAKGTLLADTGVNL